MRCLSSTSTRRHRARRRPEYFPGPCLRVPPTVRYDLAHISFSSGLCRPASSPTPSGSTSVATPAATWPSDSACTSAWGQPLARLELQVAYGTLFRRIPTLRPAIGLDQLPFKEDGIVYGVHKLPVTW